MLHELAVGFAGGMSVANLTADDLDKRFFVGWSWVTCGGRVFLVLGMAWDGTDGRCRSFCGYADVEVVAWVSMCEQVC